MERSIYLERLANAVAWGVSSERPAWLRTVERIDASQGRYRREDLELARTRGLEGVVDSLPAWFDPICAALEPGADIPDLEQSPEDIWRELVCMNYGIFAQGAGEAPLLPLLVTVASTVQGQGPLYMSLNLDGWGIQPPQ
ncbi:MAG TPA: hypothetical protein VHW23_01440 [Kofleriaceae bacterium]|jgi:hypothetical protein|nr:hypothetical protein [Kofleriaceae bacterium]